MRFNSYWYLGLSVLSIILLIYTCLKKGTVRTLLLFLIMTECAYIADTIIYTFLESYFYIPNLIKHDPYYDSNMGGLTSNFSVVPTIGTFIGICQLNRVWTLAFTALLAVIEWLFVKLKIYILYWWRIPYTSFGLFFVYFPMAKLIYKLVSQPLKGIRHSLFLFLTIAPILGTTHLLPIMFFSNRYYNPGWFQDRGHDTSAFVSIYYLCSSMLLVVLLKCNWKYGWMKYPSLGIILFIVTIILKSIGILHSLVWWDTWYYILAPIIILRIASAISKRLSLGLKHA